MLRIIMKRASLPRETCCIVHILIKANCGAQQLHYLIKDTCVYLGILKTEKLLLLVLY